MARHLVEMALGRPVCLAHPEGQVTVDLLVLGAIPELGVGWGWEQWQQPVVGPAEGGDRFKP